MLSSEITGIQQPSEMALEYIKQGNIKSLSKVIIYRTVDGLEIPTEVTNVIDYEVSEDRQFGASTLVLTTTNEDGLYSYSNKDSKHNYIYKQKRKPFSIPFMSGSYTDASYAIGDGIRLNQDKEAGSWVSDTIFPSDVTEWIDIEWEIEFPYLDSVRVVSMPYVEIYVRFGESGSIDNTWTDWFLVDKVAGSSGVNTLGRVLPREFNTAKKHLQVKLVLVAGKQFRSVYFPKTFSPTVKSIKLNYAIAEGDHRFSPLYYYGNRVEVYEAIISPDESFIEWFCVFNGFLEEVDPSQNEQGYGLRCIAFDFMKICLNGIIEKPNPNMSGDQMFESKKYGSSGNKPLTMDLQMVKRPGIDLNGDGIIDVTVDGDEEGSVFVVPIAYRNNGPIRGYEGRPGSMGDARGDRKYVPWASRPTPIIKLNGETRSDGYQIDYGRGVVYFADKIDEEDLPVTASFYWYDLNTNLFEDVLGEIIARAIEDYGYTKPTRTRYKDYDIWKSRDHSIKIILERSKPRTTIPPIGFYLENNKTYHDAIVDVLKYIEAYYLVRATPQGNFVGEYLPQKAEADYTLELVTGMNSPVSQNDIYTRCVVQGIEPFTKNVAMDAEITAPVLKPNYSGIKDNTAHLKHLVDGTLETNVGWNWEKKNGKYPEREGPPALPMEMVRFKYPDGIILGAINILCGNGVGPSDKGWGPPYGPVNLNDFGYLVEVSNDGEYWLSITNSDLRGSTGEWIQIEKSAMLPDIRGVPFRYIRILATNAPFAERGTDGVFFGLFGKTKNDCWNWAMREVQIFPDETIRAEVNIHDLVHSVGHRIPKAIADDMWARIKRKTMVLPVNTSIRSEDMARRRGLDYLYEVARNLYTSNANVVYAPHIQVGHTVFLSNKGLIEPEGNKPGRTYYVDGITRTMSGGSPSVSVKLVSWI